MVGRSVVPRRCPAAGSRSRGRPPGGPRTAARFVQIGRRARGRPGRGSAEASTIIETTRTLDVDALWERFLSTRDESAREGLVLAYLGLVKFVAGRLAIGLPSFVEVEDLFGAGLLGLMQAIDKFEADRRIKFETYAIPRIRGAMLDELRTQDWFPRSIRRKARRLEQAYAEVESRLERAATDEEVARHLDMTLDEYYALVDEVALTTLVSLDRDVSSSTDGLYSVVGETISDPRASDPVRDLEDEELRALIRDVIMGLPEKERTVLNLYYYEELTLREIGEILGISESRVCQIHTRAVVRVKARVHQAMSTRSIRRLGEDVRQARARRAAAAGSRAPAAAAPRADGSGPSPRAVARTAPPLTE